MEYNIYRLNGGLKPISFQLPLKETFVKKFITENGQKKDLGFRRMVYVPGTDTIYAEDQKGDLQPQSIWFEYGDVKVRQDDKLLNTIMTSHPWYGKRYALWSEDIEIENQLAKERAKSEARLLIEDADQDQIKAIALAVFGASAALWNDSKCELKLREKANEDPEALSNTMNEGDYNSRLLAGLAFVHKIVEENSGQTAVVWTDSDGIILKLAKGENGINELGRFLATQTDDSKKVLQSISERVDALVVRTEGKDTATILDEKDQEIADLKAQLAEASKAKEPTENEELIAARETYFTVTGKNVPNNMKNNLEWILANSKV